MGDLAQRFSLPLHIFDVSPMISYDFLASPPNPFTAISSLDKTRRQTGSGKRPNRKKRPEPKKGRTTKKREVAPQICASDFDRRRRFPTNSTPNPEKRVMRPETSNQSLPNRKIGHRGPVEIDIAAITVDATGSCEGDSHQKIAKKPGNRIERVQPERDWLQGGKIRKT